MKLNRILNIAIYSIVALLAISLLLAIIAKQFEYNEIAFLDLSGRLVLRSTTFFIGLIIIIGITRWLKIYDSSSTKIALILGLITYGSDVWGNLFSLYGRSFIFQYDKWVHCLGAVAVATALLIVFHERMKGYNKYVVGLLPVTIVCTLAGYFEVYEFLSDRHIGTDMVYSMQDTIYDLLVAYIGTFGVFISYIIYRGYMEEKR